MYYVTFTNNEIEQEEKFSFTNFNGALRMYIKTLDVPFWECDISNLKILKNNRDLTNEVNKFLSKNWRD
jgi:hypothetical protein